MLAATIVPARDDARLRACLDDINRDLKRPAGTVLHWAENVRGHADRKHVARLLGELPMTCVAIVLDKESLVGTASGLSDHTKQYNYLLRRLLERVSWYVNRHHGTARVTLAQVRRFKYQALREYLDWLRGAPDCHIDWPAIRERYPRIEQPNSIRGLQVADIVAGCVYAAVRTDRHGDHEPAYLREIAPTLWTGPSGKLSAYGLNIVGNNGRCHERLPWFSDIARIAVHGKGSR